MKPLILLAAMICLAGNAQAGIIKGAALAAKDVAVGAAEDAKRVSLAVSYPLRHPKKTAHATEKAAKAVALGVVETAVAIVGPGVPR